MFRVALISLVSSVLTMSAAYAVPVSASFNVQAAAHSSLSGGGAGLNTGIAFALNDSFSVSVDPLDTWIVNPGLGAFNANGITTLSNLVNSGLSAPFSSLVGRIGSGSFFFIGTSFSGLANAAGNLFLFNWDINLGDNSGFVTATVTYDDPLVSSVPVPAGLPLIASGLAVLAFIRRKRA